MLTNCQLLLHNLPDGTLLLDSEGYIKYVNPAVSTITGFDVQELLERSVSVIFNEQDNLRLEFELSQARKKGSFLSEGWKRKKDNTKFWGELVISSIQEGGGPVTGFACTLRNTWEKKKEEIGFRESEERYRLMVSAVKDYAIFMLDLNGNILSWNEGAKKTKGYKADEIIGKHFSTFYTAIDLQDKKPERELRIAVKEGKYEEEGWRVKKNGSVFWANVVITALFNENNQPPNKCVESRMH